MNRPSDSCSHVEFQEAIVEAAHLFGWAHLHVRRTIGRGHKWTTSTNVKGWPDLWLWHSQHGFAGVEVKVGKDKPSDEQLAVLESLAAAGAATLVAYPKDWECLLDLLRGVRLTPVR